MAQTIGEYLYRIAWQLDKKGAEQLKKESDTATKSVDGLGKSLDKTERETKDLGRAADKTGTELRQVGDASRAAKTEVNGLDNSVQNAVRSFKQFVTGMASIAAVRRTFTAIINTATQMDALANAAAAAGATATGMARLAYATDLAGVNASEMETALKGVRVSAAQAAAGIGAGVKAWRQIGISTRDENGNLKDSARLVDELGAKFAMMDEGRAQALGKMLKMTPAVIGALRNGMMEYAKEFDQALGQMTPTFEEAVKAAQDLHAAQSRLVRVFTVFWQGIASRLFKSFERAFDTLRKSIINNQAALVDLGEVVLKPLAYVLGLIADGVSVVSNAFSVLHGAWSSLTPLMQGLLQFLGGYLVYLKLITAAQVGMMLTNPFTKILGVIAGVLLLLDDYQVWAKGGKSFINWEPVVKFFKAVRDFGDDVINWFKSLPDKAREAVKSIGDAFVRMWTSVMDWFAEKWKAFVQTVTGWMPDALKKELGIEVKEEAPRFEVPTISPTVAALTDTAPAAQAAIKAAGGQPAISTPVLPTSMPAAVKAVIPPPSRVAQAVASAAAQSVAQPGAPMSGIVAGGQVLNRSTTLSTTNNITNNTDKSKHVDAPVTVTNTTNVNITTTDTDTGRLADQVGGVVDSSNAQLVRNMQSPLAAIASEDDGGMTTE